MDTPTVDGLIDKLLERLGVGFAPSTRISRHIGRAQVLAEADSHVVVHLATSCVRAILRQHGQIRLIAHQHLAVLVLLPEPTIVSREDENPRHIEKLLVDLELKHRRREDVLDRKRVAHRIVYSAQRGDPNRQLRIRADSVAENLL